MHVQNQAQSQSNTTSNAKDGDLELSLVPKAEDETIYVPVNHLAHTDKPFDWNDMYAAA